MFSPIFKPFVEKRPISVMARGMLEGVVNPDLLAFVYVLGGALVGSALGSSAGGW